MMNTKIPCSTFMSWIHALATAAVVLLIGVGDSSAAQLGDYSIQIIADDTKRDGPVNRKLYLRITNHVSKCSVELACHHWTLGQGNWSLAFSSVNVQGQSPEHQGEAVAQVVADAARIADDIVAKNYSTNHVSTVQINEQAMPSFVVRSIHESLALQMEANGAIALPAYDRNLKKMLQMAFDENKVIQRISQQLNRAGFSLPRATPPELISVRPELFGMTWKKISSESAAGLRSGSVTVIFYDLLSRD